jgi:hypothetical protein
MLREIFISKVQGSRIYSIESGFELPGPVVYFRAPNRFELVAAIKNLDNIDTWNATHLAACMV